MDIHQVFNASFAPVFTTKARYILLMGGRGRGGSHFGTDYFLHLITQPNYFRGYFLRHSFNDIRGSLWADFKDRIEGNPSINPAAFALNENPMSALYVPTGNKILSRGFKKSGQQSAKLKSLAGATHALIEEAEETEELEFYQLDDSLRTIKGPIQIILILNPPHVKHWIIKRFYNLIPAQDVLGPDFKGYYYPVPKSDPEALCIHSTYLQNEQNIADSTRRNYERYRETNFEYYATSIKGLVSEGKKGLIFRTWKPMRAAEFEALPYPSRYGLDFGYSSDPAALVEIKEHNERLYIRELVYEVGLTNPQLAARMRAIGLTGREEIVADSAEPKSIQEFRDMGFNVRPAVKGADSIRAGVQHLQGKEVYYTEESAGIREEVENYSWALDANKNPTDRPIDKFNHAIDAIRYVTTLPEASFWII